MAKNPPYVGNLLRWSTIMATAQKNQALSNDPTFAPYMPQPTMEYKTSKQELAKLNELPKLTPLKG